ncbi:beta family protein [Lysinibacillus fusiformis]|uniref:beta family protein n=1 Tax=Lysinibacillus fusiformis TaxID=28031 RepID=UPI003D08CCAF
MINKNYVPILKWKKGEMEALRELDTTLKNHIHPIIDIPNIDWDYEKDCPKKTLDEHIGQFSENVSTYWNHPNSVFVDATTICSNDNHLLADQTQPLQHLFTQLRNENIQAVPVFNINSGPNYLQAVSQINTQYQSGIALRLFQNDFDTISDKIHRILTYFSIEPEDVDLIIDFKFLPCDITNYQTILSQNSSLAILSIESIPYLSRWRSLSFCSTSFPVNLSNLSKEKLTILPRLEWDLYKRIIQSKLDRKPNFGDYTISNPTTVEIDPRLMTISANIRYTTENGFLIAKGYSVKDPKHGKWSQTRGLSRKIIESQYYFGRPYSYGDNYIYECANETVGVGNSRVWRKVGVNHHLTVAVNTLSNYLSFSIYD